MLLRKYHSLVLKRDKRYYALLFLNTFFGLISAYICYAAFTIQQSNTSRYNFTVSLALLVLYCFSEFYNIIMPNSIKNVYSQEALKLFPISQFEILKSYFINSLLGLRILLYVFISLILLYYSLANSISTFPILVLGITTFYFSISVIRSILEYGYSLLKYRYEDKLEKIVLLTMLTTAIVISLSGIDEKQMTQLDWLSPLINYILRQ